MGPAGQRVQLHLVLDTSEEPLQGRELGPQGMAAHQQLQLRDEHTTGLGLEKNVAGIRFGQLIAATDLLNH